MVVVVAVGWWWGKEGGVEMKGEGRRLMSRLDVFGCFCGGLGWGVGLLV